MSTLRQEKLKKTFKKEISTLLREKIQDPRIRDEFLTITDVEFSKDLKRATVYIYIHDKAKKEIVFKGLKSATKFIQEEIGRVMRLRYTPILTFKEDKSIDRGYRVIEILEKLKHEEDSREDTE
ncbi:MAG: 30S ribosome-binding factor RbfA [Caldiserica bacterium]|nr:MAG: 30S ribosome-binding factor RbfA [Caldisericota bacterium]